jgi:rare lipoprotein A
MILICAGFLASCSRHPAPVPPISGVPTVGIPADNVPSGKVPPASAKVKPYKVLGEWYYPISDAASYKEKGIASWYGPTFHGKKTANGETYNMYAMTAAHKTLPLGTYVSVRNLENDKKVTLRINDRGPFVRGRIIDLSRTAARELDVLGPGTAKVEVVALSVPRAVFPSEIDPADTVARVFETGRFTIQVGSFAGMDNAMALKSQLEGNHSNVHIVTFDSGEKKYYRVRAGLCRTLEEAKEYETRMIQKGFDGAFIIAE